MHEFFMTIASWLNALFGYGMRPIADDRTTLVLGLPMGLGLTSYQSAFLATHSIYEPTSFGDFSARARHADHRVQWSGEGHVSCFERLVMCNCNWRSNIFSAGSALVDYYAPYLPYDPLGFRAGGPGATPRPLPPLVNDTTLRVAIEVRTGASRTFTNLHAILQDCERASLQGFRGGRFTSIACRPLHTADSPDLYGVPRFLSAVAATRSAHVLVAFHGAGAANAAFLERGNHTALVEVRSCMFGSRHCYWPNAYMHDLIKDQRSVRFMAYNVDDPAQCSPPDYAEKYLANRTMYTEGLRTDQVLVMTLRDQHLTLRPPQFLTFLQHVGTVLSNSSAYEEAERQERLHAYALQGGRLVFSKLCVENVTLTFGNAPPSL
ncbi:hypothetical protein HYH03_017535 [Edaphochlamys debaryana]|uniref:Uncharacterized protein n=1 Tax=Edaphochlamys debaryana TaxID=47281 RepID=A0A835XIU6_9CHLO|nr:hypothetical protein HYH03_017535 [Edaphochlamys debaryana]|eukprot:KAG2483593.1 hypothetical protein HYH03_017535 [Edaphochlamys debaryana]